MSDHIEIKDAGAGESEHVVIQEPKPQGYLAFYRLPNCNWLCASNFAMDRDYARYPWPLYPTREEAIEAVKKCLPQGGEAKIIKVML